MGSAARAPLSTTGLIVRLSFQHFATTIEAVRADVMAQMQFTGVRLHGGGWVTEKVVRAVHTTLGRGFFVLLDSHDDS